jgi:hypothetical protein
MKNLEDKAKTDWREWIPVLGIGFSEYNFRKNIPTSVNQNKEVEYTYTLYQTCSLGAAAIGIAAYLLK